MNGQEMSDYCTLKARLFYKACGVLEAIYLNLGTFKKGICSVIAWLDIMHIQAVLKLRGKNTFRYCCFSIDVSKRSMILRNLFCRHM